MVRVLVRAWRTAVRTCRRFAGSFNSGKARSIATISARIFLSVTSAPSRANSRSRSAPSSIVLAIRTPVAAAHRCIRRRCTLQCPSSSTQRCPRDANTRPLRTTPYVQHPMRLLGLSRFGGTLRFTCVRWSTCSPHPRLVRRAVAKRDQHRTGTDAFRSRQAQRSLSRPRHGSAASARRAALASSDWTRSWGSSRGRRNHHITVPRRIRKWRTPTRPPRT